MAFLRRLFGGGDGQEPARDDPPDDASGASDLDEAARDRELLLDEARRLDSDLIQRQLRYADRAWTPPAQGGDRRADDQEADAGRQEPGAKG
jgi:hypothetical protein